MTTQQFSSRVINNQLLQNGRYIPSAKGQEMCGGWIRNPPTSKPVSLTTRQKGNLPEFRKQETWDFVRPLNYHITHYPTLFNSGKQTGCCLILMGKQLCLYHLHLIHCYENKENNIREHNGGASSFDSTVCQKSVCLKGLEPLLYRSGALFVWDITNNRVNMSVWPKATLTQQSPVWRKNDQAPHCGRLLFLLLK